MNHRSSYLQLFTIILDAFHSTNGKDQHFTHDKYYLERHKLGKFE